MGIILLALTCTHIKNVVCVQGAIKFTQSDAVQFYLYCKF